MFALAQSAHRRTLTIAGCRIVAGQFRERVEAHHARAVALVGRSHAARIALDAAKLGFSFEAQQIAVESLNADPLVITDCVFTGAAFLMKDTAAYRTTALAILAAKEKECLPVSTNLKIAAGAAPSAGFVLPHLMQLTRIMAARGVSSPGDVDRLDEGQLAKILDGRTTAERIDLKSKILAANIYPRNLPVATPFRIPGW